MAKFDLDALYRLHRIDDAMQGIQREASAMDMGQRASAKIKKLTPEYDQIVGEATAAHAKLKDSELQAKSLDEKIKKASSELYGGKIVNPREVEAYEKDIAMLKRQRSELDDEMLELMEQLPEIESKAERAKKVMDQLKQEVAAKQRDGKDAWTKLDTEYKELAAKRKKAAVDVAAELLAKYEAIRKNHEGIGMAEVDKRAQCARCGTNLPEKTILAVKEGNYITCENCRRILFWVQPV